MKAKHILVSGKVQGVGYRNFVHTCALELGVYGNVRNLPSGQVEVFARSEEEILESFIQKLKKGPLRSRVENLEIHDIKIEIVDFSEFVILL